MDEDLKTLENYIRNHAQHIVMERERFGFKHPKEHYILRVSLSHEPKGSYLFNREISRGLATQIADMFRRAETEYHNNQDKIAVKQAIESLRSLS